MIVFGGDNRDVFYAKCPHFHCFRGFGYSLGIRIINTQNLIFDNNYSLPQVFFP